MGEWRKIADIMGGGLGHERGTRHHLIFDYLNMNFILAIASTAIIWAGADPERLPAPLIMAPPLRSTPPAPPTGRSPYGLLSAAPAPVVISPYSPARKEVPAQLVPGPASNVLRILPAQPISRPARTLPVQLPSHWPEVPAPIVLPPSHFIEPPRPALPVDEMGPPPRSTNPERPPRDDKPSGSSP